MRIELLRADVTSLKVDAMVSPSESAEVSSGGNLLAKFIIPAKVPNAASANAEQELRNATTTALERAESLAIASVGLLPMWTAPEVLERGARNMLQAALDFRVRARSLQRVVFVVFGGPTYAVFERLLQELDS